MVRYSIEAKGFRTQSITVITTLLNPEEYSAEDIAELYGLRWSVELDIRHVKRALNMLRSLCDEVPPEVFTMDISSSDLRREEPQ